MDFIESLGKQISEITAYDVKSYYDKAKNIVMNYTEMESKVREATNDDAWGASSTLMQEIASATFNFQLFNEIMGVIYKRFTEKEAREWRQIYKALQLLEYLIKHGSERVVDDARSHLSMIKMLRNFHYIDEKGKDQGINVRNRSKEIAELLSDLDRVRQERRKAKQNKNKYTGVGRDGMSSMGGGAGPSFTSPTGSRYGGFGSDTFGASSASGSSYPDTYPSSSRSTRRESFEEYDAGDDEVREDDNGARSPTVHAPAPIKKDTPKIKQEKPKAKEVNLFDFDDDEPASASSAAAPAAAMNSLSLDDDFDDFQSAGAATVPAAAAPTPSKPAPQQQSSGNFFDMMGGSVAPAAPAQPQMRTGQNMPAGPNYANSGLFGSSGGLAPSRPAMSTQSSMGKPMAPSASSSSVPTMATTSSSGNKPKSGAGAFDFDDLFAASGAKKATAPVAGQNSMASLAQQKQSNSLWGSSAGASNGNKGGSSGDLLF